MKFSMQIVLQVLAVFFCFAKATDGTVVSQTYLLDGDFNKIRASAHIKFELTHVNRNPSVIIETEEWVHTNRYITVTTRSDNYLDVNLTSGINYPEIKVNVEYRTALASLEIDGVGSMISRNVIFSNPSSSLNIANSGTGSVILNLDHHSDIVVSISGTGRITLSGQVKGNGVLRVSGTGKLDAMACPMNIVQVEVTGFGVAYVNGVGIHATVSGSGMICYKGTLLTQQVSGFGSVTRCIYEPTPEGPEPTPEGAETTTPEGAETTTPESEYSSAESNKIMSRNRRLMVISVTIIFLLFFQRVIV